MKGEPNPICWDCGLRIKAETYQAHALGNAPAHGRMLRMLLRKKAQAEERKQWGATFGSKFRVKETAR